MYGLPRGITNKSYLLFFWIWKYMSWRIRGVRRIVFSVGAFTHSSTFVNNFFVQATLLMVFLRFLLPPLPLSFFNQMSSGIHPVITCEHCITSLYLLKSITSSQMDAPYKIMDWTTPLSSTINSSYYLFTQLNVIIKSTKHFENWNSNFWN